MSLTILGGTPAQAATFAVTNLNDAGVGSLRAAIAAANAAAGPDVIIFAAGLTGTIPLSTGQLTISDSLQIVGPGRAALTVNGGARDRVFDIPLSPGDVQVGISGLTITNGKAETGGGIRVQDESLTLDDVALTGNTAIGNGGGLYADGFAMTLTVRNSTISGNTASKGGGVYVEDTKGVTTFDRVVIDGNTASEQGGGIFFYDPDNDVVINNSTITNNVARKGGGIYLYSQDNGSFTISNSTISGNRATTAGGGVYLYDIDHPVFITNSTISGNTATNGAGINIDRISAPAVISNSTISGNTATGTATATGVGGGIRVVNVPAISLLTLRNTIIANSTGSNCSPGLVDGGGNLSDDLSCNFTAASSLNNTLAQLGPLADNGGPTHTMKPLTGSPAIDQGVNTLAVDANGTALATDQRGSGFARISPAGGTVDRGAFEVQALPGLSVTPTSLSFGTVPVHTPRASMVTLTNNSTSPVKLRGVWVTPGAGTGYFAFAPLSLCPWSLAPGKSCRIYVGLFAYLPGAKTATLNIPNSATGSPQGVALSAQIVPRR